MKSSKEYRKIASKIRIAQLKKEMRTIISQIEKESKKGLFHVHLEITAMQENQYVLIDAGFRVTNRTGHTCIGW